MFDKDYYLKQLKTLEELYKISLDLSDLHGGITVPWHLVRANQLYIGMTVTCTSIIHLLPHNKLFSCTEEFWDFFQ